MPAPVKAMIFPTPARDGTNSIPSPEIIMIQERLSNMAVCQSPI
jgi:hypothetical protein